MSQNPVAPADGTGAAYETNVTNALNTALTKSSGAAAPSELLGYRDWADTATGKLKAYSAAGAAWIDQGYLDAPFMGNVRPFGNGGQTAYENLRITRPTATTLLVTADDAYAVDTATPKRGFRTGALNVTVDSAVSGAAGLDTGSISNGNWYHIWAIYNPSTLTASALISLAYPGSGAVTMPAGYTAKGYLGAAYYVSASFNDFSQIGGSVASKEVQVLVIGTNTAATSINTLLRTAVPQNAIYASGYAGCSDTTSGISNLAILSFSSGNVGRSVIRNMGGGVGLVYSAFRAMIVTAQTLWYAVDTNNVGNMFVTGYEF